MKAVWFKNYGSPEKVIQIKELPIPQPKAEEVLVKVHATTVNDSDWSLVRGKPYLYRLFFGLSKPKNPIPGMELSGTIEQSGKKVDKWKKGDAVMGDISDYGFGSFAEYVCIHQDALVTKPNHLSFEEAAAIPHASTLAQQALEDLGQISSKERVLINGAGGGVGSLGLQIAKMYDCEVTGVDSSAKLEKMRALGFDEVIDYQKTDFTKNGLRYDLILDCKSSKSPFSYLRALNKNGRYISIGGKVGRLISILFWGKLISKLSGKRMQILNLQMNKNLEGIAEKMKAWPLEELIDGPHSLEEAGRLIKYFGEGKHYGKVVIKVR